MNQQLVTLLSQLATKLGTTVQYLYGVEVKQAYVTALQNGLWFLLFVVIGIVSAVIGVRCYRKYQKVSAEWFERRGYNNEDGTSEGLATVLCALGVLISVIFIMVFANNIIADLVNPQNWAFNTLMSLVSGH